MWVRYYLLLKSSLDMIMNNFKAVWIFPDDQGELYYLHLSAHSLVMSLRIFCYETPNDDCNLVTKYFCDFED